MDKKLCCDGYVRLKIGQQSYYKDARRKYWEKRRIEESLYAGIFFFNPMDNEEPLKMFECESDIMKVVFWENWKGDK